MPTKLTVIAGAIEAAVGLVLIIAPSLVSSLLLGGNLSIVGEAVGRVAGFALIGLGAACWPGPKSAGVIHAARGLCIYNALAAIFFVYLGVRGDLVGVLLWPAAALHAALALLLARVLAVATPSK